MHRNSRGGINTRTIVLDERDGAALYEHILTAVQDTTGSCKLAKAHHAKYEEDLLYFSGQGCDSKIISYFECAIRNVEEEIKMLTFRAGMLAKTALQGSFYTQELFASLGQLYRLLKKHRKLQESCIDNVKDFLLESSQWIRKWNKKLLICRSSKFNLPESNEDFNYSKVCTFVSHYSFIE